MKELQRFATTLAGHFSNFEQAQRNPKDFAHINIYFIPLCWKINSLLAFYSEQSYDYNPWTPYRQSFHTVSYQSDTFIVDNYSLDDSSLIAGAGQHPELLNSVNTKLIKKRCGCAMHFREVKNSYYQGNVEPGRQCLVHRNGIVTYLISEVEFGNETWTSRDRGFDLITHKQRWGSEHGMLRFKRVKFFKRVD